MITGSTAQLFVADFHIISERFGIFLGKHPYRLCFSKVGCVSNFPGLHHSVPLEIYRNLERSHTKHLPSWHLPAQS